MLEFPRMYSCFCFRAKKSFYLVYMGLGATSADSAAPISPLTEKLVEIQEHLEGIRDELEQMPQIPSDAMTYSELKMQLMVNYVANLSYYLSLKHRGEQSIGDHPVFKHLAFLRTFMERLAPLDAALKYQIDRLLISQDGGDDDQEFGEKDGGAQSSSAGPNLAAFIPMKAAVKGISVEQVKKSLAGSVEGGPMEIDPSLIAARIAKMQQSSGNKKKSKRRPASDDEGDDMSDFSADEEEMAPKKKSKKKQQKKPVDSDDESIDSEDI